MRPPKQTPERNLRREPVLRNVPLPLVLRQAQGREPRFPRATPIQGFSLAGSQPREGSRIHQRQLPTPEGPAPSCSEADERETFALCGIGLSTQQGHKEHQCRRQLNHVGGIGILLTSCSSPKLRLRKNTDYSHPTKQT